MANNVRETNVMTARRSHDNENGESYEENEKK